MSNWRVLSGYYWPYRINDDGRVEVKKSDKWTLVKPYIQRCQNGMYGELFVHMRMPDYSRKNVRVKNLMVDAFFGGDKKGKFVTLKNGMISDVSVYNIRFVTRSEAGKRSGGPNRKSVEKIDRDGNVIELYSSISEAAKKNFLHRSAVSERCTGKIKNPFDLTGYSFRFEQKRGGRPRNGATYDYSN